MDFRSDISLHVTCHMSPHYKSP